MPTTEQPRQSTQMDHIKLSPVETLTSAISLQQVVNTNIYVFSILDLSRANIDALIDRIILETEKQADPLIPTFWLHDASSCTTMSLSPYLRHRITDLIRHFPDRVGYNAVIMPNTFVVQIIALFMRTMPTRSKNQLFFDREKGLRWLYGVAAPYQKADPQPSTPQKVDSGPAQTAS